MSTQAEKTLRHTLNAVDLRLRPMALARVIFDLPARELASLKVGQLQKMIRRRLQGDLKLACKALVMEWARDLELGQGDYLIKSRNYGGQYPVSRGSIWRWFKGTDLVQALRKRASGVMKALSVLTEHFWSRVAVSDNYEAGFTLEAVRGPPTAEEQALLFS